MKKLKKIIAGLLSAVTALSAMTAFSVNAEESEEKLYTLEELFTMSEEEFLALGEDAWGFHYEVKSDAEYFIQVSDTTAYGGISGNVFAELYLEDEGVKYTANITEKEISALLGDTVEYNIDSPISLDVEELLENNLYYGNLLWISFPEYEVYSGTNDISDEEILEFAKCCYCVNQVIEVKYSDYGAALSVEPSNEEILIGDANLDKSVDLYDVIHITKHVAMNFEFTALQKAITDVNNDGIVNSVDAVSVGMQIMENVT